MKSNNFKNRLTALALCFTLLLGAAPITHAYAVNDESDTSSSQSDSDSSDTSSTDSGSTDSKDTKDMTADNDKGCYRSGKRSACRNGYRRSAHQPGFRHGAV